MAFGNRACRAFVSLSTWAADRRSALLMNDDLCLFELLEVDVIDLGREVLALLQAKDAHGPHGVHQDAQRRDGVIVAIEATQRVGDGGL